jgi:hypothetical protein
MHEHAPVIQKHGKVRVAVAPVIDPDRGVDQDHAEGRRRGVAFSLGCVLPRRASLRALSRSISARSPSRITVVRSTGPSSRVALASSSSSMSIVVRMALLREWRIN